MKNKDEKKDSLKVPASIERALPISEYGTIKSSGDFASSLSLDKDYASGANILPKDPNSFWNRSGAMVAPANPASIHIQPNDRSAYRIGSEVSSGESLNLFKPIDIPEKGLSKKEVLELLKENNANQTKRESDMMKRFREEVKNLQINTSDEDISKIEIPTGKIFEWHCSVCGGKIIETSNSKDLKIWLKKYSKKSPLLCKKYSHKNWLAIKDNEIVFAGEAMLSDSKVFRKNHNDDDLTKSS